MFWAAAQTALVVSAHPFWTQIHATFLSSLSLLHLFFSSRSHFYLRSSGEALVCYLATVSMATEMLPVPPSLLCPLTKVLVKAWVCSCVWEQSSELFTLLPHTLLVCNASVWMDDWCLSDLHGSNMLYNSEDWWMLPPVNGDTDAVKHHIKMLFIIIQRTWESEGASSAREGNISVHSDMNACVGATERSIYIPSKNRHSCPQRREILQSGELLCRCRC